jgi:hypothetical protein
MQNDQQTCQGCNPADSSGPAVPYVVYRFFWFLKNRGVVFTLRKLVPAFKIRILHRIPKSSRPAAPGVEEVLGLQPGDAVEVRSEREILETLDEYGRYKGMAFMPGMSRYCGGRFRVHKRLENILFEESGRRRRMKNTVLLDGLICDGEGRGCDRSCFYFWREAWLKRVSDPSPSRDEGVAVSATPFTTFSV